MNDLPRDRLANRREQVLELCTDAGLSDVRVFGSVARGDDEPDSDIDLLFTPGTDTTLICVAILRGELTDLLGCPVDLLSVGGLDPDRHPGDAAIVRDARPLVGWGP